MFQNIKAEASRKLNREKTEIHLHVSVECPNHTRSTGAIKGQTCQNVITCEGCQPIEIKPKTIDGDFHLPIWKRTNQIKPSKKGTVIPKLAKSIRTVLDKSENTLSEDEYRYKRIICWLVIGFHRFNNSLSFKG